MKYVYPVIFTQTEDESFLIEVPDLEIATQGDDMANAIDMARDAIGLKGITMQDRGKKIPNPSALSEIDTKKGIFAAEGEPIVSFVDIDFDVYRRKLDNKAVRRNVTLPNWLNQEADAAGINVSKVLQEALAERLHVQR